MKKGEILENIEVEKLVFGGKGFARHSDGKVIFITGGAIPGSMVNLRIIKKRKDFYETQITEIIKKSPIETGKYAIFPGAPWINIDYQEQLKIKDNQIKEAFFHILKLSPEIPGTKGLNFLPIVGAENIFGYRNKIEFSFGKYISHREKREEHFNAGFHKQGEFSKILDYDSCDLIDDESNAIYKEIKDFAKTSGLPVYDQKTQEGFWRHLIIRKTYFTEQIMIILSFYDNFFEDKKEREDIIQKIKNFFAELQKKYLHISSIYLSYNNNKADIAIDRLELINGKEVITEKLLNLEFDIGPKSFFQTNSLGAEKLYSLVRDFAKKELYQNGITLDLYAGTGTIGMIFADISKEVYSVEMVEEASKNGEENAKKNEIQNMIFINKKVEDFLDAYINDGKKADILIIDPPRAGMHPSTLPHLLTFNTKQILYVSCNPATLVRDLEYILKNSSYKIEKIQAVDMFPHTHHIETIVSLLQV
ncbi:23S rRNA (uracil(1939)-C(5))-methyltransferase RlmD [Candidatus Gracilibacteria bacterium]|nr:23S rRNA (uracil(1939)-C(5))-methyltransferase RlmD [Candidatus Gracilibacteria bacterium]NUJ99253.1 23S rRNA (uracil(1939)-C(5))-methyltransferase RlmD [Candidatus Gracilibacteria bacterium]